MPVDLDLGEGLLVELLDFALENVEIDSLS